jgi:hypothetical protein
MVSQCDIIKLFVSLYFWLATPWIAAMGCQFSGVFGLRIPIFFLMHSAPAFVTDQPQPDCTSTIWR